MRRVVIKNDKRHKTKTLDDYKINGFSQLFFYHFGKFSCNNVIFKITIRYLL